MQKYMPGAELTDIDDVYGYRAAQTGAQVFSQCGQDLSRGNIMRQAANMTATGWLGIKRLRVQRFNGQAWVPFGDLVAA